MDGLDSNLEDDIVNPKQVNDNCIIVKTKNILKIKEINEYLLSLVSTRKVM